MSKPNKSKRRSLKELQREGRKLNQNENKDFIVIEDIYEKCTNSKLIKKLRSGLVFDDKFTKHECIWDPNYPENPQRYTCIIDRFNEYNLIERCDKITNRLATREEICAVHDAKQVVLLESTSKMNATEMESLASQYDSVYFNQDTHEVSHLATGSVLNLVQAVVNGSVQNGMAVVRPPGHHAMKENYCGYCYYNNVAIAAQYALDKLNLSRILIVDWDVHHGQATQQMFYNDPRVVYFSIHRYEQGQFWPHLRESNFDHVGSGEGYGYNINLPLNEIGCGDVDYLTIFHSILLPVAYEFEPDLVLVSAGYDAAIGCREGQMLVSPGCYHHLTTSLMGLAAGKIVVCLEGGYFLPSLSESAAQTLKALLGDPAPRLDKVRTQKSSVLTSIYNVISILRNKWKCFSHFNFENTDEKENDNMKNHVVEVVYKGIMLEPPFETRNCYPRHTNSQHQQFLNEVRRLRKSYCKEQRLNKVGYVYNQVMELHKSPEINNFEKPERLTRTLSILKELDILDRMKNVHSREATEEEIILCHDSEYVSKVERLGAQSEAALKNSQGWVTVFMSEHSLKSARMAAGSLVEMVQAVSEGAVSSGVAIIRPPGHHAEHAAAGGFCILNNVAIAAHHALRNNLAQRILVIDWDIHHGNGIQHMFYEDPRVLYLSLHRYENARFFPNSEDADTTCTGAGPGTGYTVNVAWNNGSMADAEYISAWTRVLLPIAYQFDPDLVLVAAGFDACRGDPLGGYNVSPQAYGHLVQLLKTLAGGRIVLALEGGYNVNSVAYSLAMCVKALLNDPLPPLVGCGAVTHSAIHSLDQTIGVHQDYWSLLLKPVSFS